MQKFLLLIACSVVFVGCINFNREKVTGSGNITTESRDLGNFKGVRLMGPMDVLIKKAESNSVELEAEDNILTYIETYVEDGRLTIKYKDNVNINSKKDVTITVGTPVLEEASVLGSGNIESEGTFSTEEKVKVQITGSGNIKLQLDAPSVKANITGSGDMELSGRTKDVDCSTTGSGTIKATELLAENAVAQTAGSGDIRVYGSLKIHARITGSGDISYKGGGTVSSKITGSGSVHKVD